MLAAAVALGLALVVAGCDSGPPKDEPAGGEESSAAPEPDVLPKRRAFTVATFNVLGASHTSPGGGAAEYYPPARERVAGALARIRQYRPDILGLQELQGAQAAAFRRRLGDRYGYAGNLDNAVMWRRAEFELVEQSTLSVPYFYDNLREMPVVVLERKRGGELITVLSVHNPADVRGDASDNRLEAQRRERAFVVSERERGRHVLLVGDLNAEEDAFCALTEGGAMRAANGGSHGDAGCEPPSDAGIDWILGAGVDFNGYLSDDSTRDDKVSDHPFVVATVRRLT
ncbi:endonuclease/exonuclease/phosphatase family protein [Nocardioides sp. GXZ039]|uniref:endonuclease/exonuclease/phosphatase family protein n=1 Tax=Nocardioides sp. GXZ039 TaxID=3136018 RepID=UPI0030F398FE